jgi:hypothetical protein
MEQIGKRVEDREVYDKQITRRFWKIYARARKFSYFQSKYNGFRRNGIAEQMKHFRARYNRGI